LASKVVRGGPLPKGIARALRDGDGGARCGDVVLQLDPEATFTQAAAVLDAMEHECGQPPRATLRFDNSVAWRPPHGVKDERFATKAKGRLHPREIQRVVRASYPAFRMCYEAGLTKSPRLEGSVAVRFVIGRDGTVEQASRWYSTIADGDVVECVVEAFRELRFPEPDGGIVMVTYPIRFAPG
jgi:hypothetical protein